VGTAGQRVFVAARQLLQRPLVCEVGRWQDQDLKSSKYIWLPLTLSGDDKLALDFHETWQLNVTRGQ
jgi:hypothetical protein